MPRALTPKTRLDTLKKDARRWLNALRGRDPEAHARLAQIAPRPADAAPPGLRHVQHALALEYGFASWAALKERLADDELARQTHGERVAAFFDHACNDHPGRQQIAARLLERHPEIARDSMQTAAVCGDLDEIARRLAARPEEASNPGGPRAWAPLLYLCYGRLPIAAARDHTLPIAIARLLLDAGATPHAYFDIVIDDHTYRCSALCGLMGEGEQQAPPHPQAEALALLLLERGADPFDRQALYNTSLGRDDDRWLELLFAHAGKRAIGAAEGAAVGAAVEAAHAGNDRPNWNAVGPPDRADSVVTLDYLLGNAVVRNHVRRATWLLAHGARATAAHFYSKRPLHEEALLRGFTELAALLARHGAAPGALAGQDAFQAACMRLDRAAAEAALDGHPEYLQSPEPLFAAADFDRPDVAALLLDLGVSPDVARENGQRALHAAAGADSPGVASLLIARGALVDAREGTHDSTPLGWALFLRKARMIDLLAGASRDVFDLTAAGKVDRLRGLLAAEPALARRIESSSGDTPLFCLPQDDDLAAEIAELFLALGTDPTIRNRDGVTAVDCARMRGLDDAAETIAGPPHQSARGDR